MYVCMYVCMYVYIYTHTQICTRMYIRNLRTRTRRGLENCSRDTYAHVCSIALVTRMLTYAHVRSPERGAGWSIALATAPSASAAPLLRLGPRGLASGGG
jgi:hypothetical protein